MTGWELPKALNIGGRDYEIRSDFRAVLDVLAAFNDPDLTDEEMTLVMLEIIYPGWENIPPEHIEEACIKAAEFIDCGQKDDGKPKPRLIDWEQDASIIVPAINSVAHTEVRAVPYLHWWSFFGYFMEIRESLFSSVLNIRQKKIRHKKLEKWEQEFYRENKHIVDLKTPESEESKAVKDNMMKFL